MRTICWNEASPRGNAHTHTTVVLGIHIHQSAAGMTESSPPGCRLGARCVWAGLPRWSFALRVVLAGQFILPRARVLAHLEFFRMGRGHIPHCHEAFIRPRPSSTPSRPSALKRRLRAKTKQRTHALAWTPMCRHLVVHLHVVALDAVAPQFPKALAWQRPPL